jgi:hypothetical protein
MSGPSGPPQSCRSGLCAPPSGKAKTTRRTPRSGGAAFHTQKVAGSGKGPQAKPHPGPGCYCTTVLILTDEMLDMGLLHMCEGSQASPRRPSTFQDNQSVKRRNLTWPIWAPQPAYEPGCYCTTAAMPLRIVQGYVSVFIVFNTNNNQTTTNKGSSECCHFREGPHTGNITCSRQTSCRTIFGPPSKENQALRRVRP